MAESEYEDFSDLEGGTGKKQRRSAAGRKLMRWNPDIDQYILLAVDIACSEVGTPVPWNYVAEKVNPTLTGEGIKQHLAKVRKYRYEANRPVPERQSKGKNRKIVAYGTGATTTPKKRGARDELTGKGAGLLWTDPSKKTPQQVRAKEEADEAKAHELKVSKKKASGGDTMLATPKTPAKKARASAVKTDALEHAVSKKKSTGKRCRAKKDSAIKGEESDDYFDDQSPVKKQRLRSTYPVNYDETQLAGDPFGEDVYEARGSQDDGDDAYDDGYYMSQPNTLSTAEYGSSRSRSSHNGYNTPVAPRPNFDNMMYARTGLHTYDPAYNGEHPVSQFGVPFDGLNTSYGPGAFGHGGHITTNPGEILDSGSQMNSPPQLTADQVQVHAQNAEYGGYGSGMHRQGHDHYGDATPPRKAKKQNSRKETDEIKSTPTSKKSKKKDQGMTRQVKKDASSRKQRKDSAHGSYHNTDHQMGDIFTNDTFGNISIAKDTGSGVRHVHDQGMPDLSIPSVGYEQQQPPMLTTSPTDMVNGDFKFPVTAPTYGNNSTGITPHLNNFSFDSGIGIDADFTMRTGEVGAHVDCGGEVSIGGTGSMHTSFSSSNDVSAAGSLSDQTMPSWGMHGGAHAGVGLAGGWVPANSVGMGMDMIDDGEQDPFSFLNDEILD